MLLVQWVVGGGLEFHIYSDIAQGFHMIAKIDCESIMAQADQSGCGLTSGVHNNILVLTHRQLSD